MATGGNLQTQPAAQTGSQVGEGAEKLFVNGINSRDLDSLLTSALGLEEPSTPPEEQPADAGDTPEEQQTESKPDESAETPVSEPEPEAQENADETTPKSEEQGEDSDEPEWFQKRINKLTRARREAEERVERLESQIRELQEKTPEPAAQVESSSPFSSVWDEKSWSAEMNKALAIEEWCEDHPEGGELGGRELTAEQVKQVARNVRRAMRVDAPARKEFIRQHSELDPVATSIYPWWNDRSSELHNMAQNLVREFPALKTRPDYKIIVGDYILGLKTRMSAANGKKAAPQPAPKPAPRQPAKPVAAAPKVDQAAVEREAMKKRFIAKGDVMSLAELL